MNFIEKYTKVLVDNYIYVIFVFSLFGVVGSLYASEVQELTPCILCWYQRILLYPLLVISVVAIFLKDAKAAYYVLPFAVIGAPLALFHYLLQKTDIFESLEGACGSGIACSTIDMQLLGFITIPFLSLLAFLGVGVLSILKIKSQKK